MRARAPCAARGRLPEPVGLAAHARSAPSARSPLTVIEPKVAATWKVRLTPSCQMSRGFKPGDVAARRTGSRRSPAELAVDHVEAGRLAGAVGPDHAPGTRPCAMVKLTLAHGVHAAERLVERLADLEHRSCARLPRLRQIDDARRRCPDGKASTSSSDHRRRAARASIRSARITVSCRTAKTEAPTIGSG